MSSGYPLPVLIREAFAAGYKRFRHDSVLPVGLEEPPSSMSIYHRPPADEDVDSVEGGGSGEDEDDDADADQENYLTDEMIGAAPLLTDEEYEEYARRRRPTLEEQASYHRTRLEHAYRWGAARGLARDVALPLPAHIVARYKHESRIAAHGLLSMAFARGRAPGDHGAVLLEIARQRCDVAVATEQRVRTASQTACEDVSIGFSVTQAGLAVEALWIFGVMDLAALRTDGLSCEQFRRMLPRFWEWARTAVGFSSRSKHVSFRALYGNASHPVALRVLSDFLAVFGLNVRRRGARIRFEGLSLWALAAGEGMIGNDFRPSFYLAAWHR